MKELTPQDREKIEVIRDEIERQVCIREQAEAEIAAQYARLDYFQNRCSHPNGYQTSCMGDLGFKCDDCGYER